MTSQIFANIYLHEFDRLVRHNLKPLAYVRYGDDFLLFARSKLEAESFQAAATLWLQDNLRLKVHTKNNVIVQPKHGLHVLGHLIYPGKQLIVDWQMRSKVSRNLSTSNIANYKAMYLPRRYKRALSHKLLSSKSPKL